MRIERTHHFSIQFTETITENTNGNGYNYNSDDKIVRNIDNCPPGKYVKVRTSKSSWYGL